GRRAAETPEVLRLDLTRIVLELHAWALADARRLRWLDPPPPQAIERAEQLLAHLGALDPATGALTPIGRRMLELPAEPRLARLLVEAEQTGSAAEGTLLAALACRPHPRIPTRFAAPRSPGFPIVSRGGGRPAHRAPSWWAARAWCSAARASSARPSSSSPSTSSAAADRRHASASPARSSATGS